MISKKSILCVMRLPWLNPTGWFALRQPLEIVGIIDSVPWISLHDLDRLYTRPILDAIAGVEDDFVAFL